MAELNPKQKRFVEEYLVDMNATQAYIRAGYSPKNADVNSTQLMGRPSVRACIDKAIAERSRRTGVTVDRVVRELARIALADPTKIINTETGEIVTDDNEDNNAAIASIRVKTTKTKDGEDVIDREVRVWDKNKALELLGKHLGMYTDKLQVNGETTIKVSIDDED
jgi:phage terminase small subunit